MARIVQFNRLTQAAKLSLIETMVREFENPETIAPQLPANVMNKLKQTAQQMRAIRNQRIEKTEASQRSTKAYQQSLTTLRMRLRHAFQLVKRKAKQPDFPSSIVISFGLNSNGTYPRVLQQLPEPLQIAKDIIQAEQNAQAQGHNVLTDPSEEELSQLVEEVEQNEAKRSLAITEACQTKEQEQQQIKACDKLIKQIRHYISFAMTGQSPRRQQKVLEALGFTFTGKQNPEERASQDGTTVVAGLSTSHRSQITAKPTTEPDTQYPTNASPPTNAPTSTKQWQSNDGTPMSLQGLDSSCPTHASPPDNAGTPKNQGPSNGETPMQLQGLDSSSPFGNPPHASPPTNVETPTKQWRSNAGTPMSLQGLDSSSPTHASPPTNAETPKVRAHLVCGPAHEFQPCQDGTPISLQGLDSSSPFGNPPHASPPTNAETPTKQWPSNAGTPMSLQGLDSSSPTHASPPTNAETPIR